MLFLFTPALAEGNRTGGNKLDICQQANIAASADKGELAQPLAPPLDNERASDGERVRRNSPRDYKNKRRTLCVFYFCHLRAGNRTGQKRA